MCRAARPRASATAALVKKPKAVRASCITSATAGIFVRRPLRVSMPTAWASTPTGSVRRATITVRTVFSCVASRNRAPTGPFGRESSDRESSALRPPPRGRFTAWAQRPAILRIATSSEKISAPKLGRDLRSRGPAAPHRLAPVPLGTRTRRPRGSDAPSGPDPLGEPYNFSPLNRSSRGGSYFLLCGRK